MIKPGTYKGVMTTHDPSQAAKMVSKIYDGNILTAYRATNQYTEGDHIYWKIELELRSPDDPKDLKKYKQGDIKQLKDILKFTSEVNDDHEVRIGEEGYLEKGDILDLLNYIPSIWRVRKHAN